MSVRITALEDACAGSQIQYHLAPIDLGGDLRRAPIARILTVVDIDDDPITVCFADAEDRRVVASGPQAEVLSYLNEFGYFFHLVRSRTPQRRRRSHQAQELIALNRQTNP